MEVANSEFIWAHWNNQNDNITYKYLYDSKNFLKVCSFPWLASVEFAKGL